MLALDIEGSLAKTITPSKGIPEQEFQSIATGLRRYIEDFLREREQGGHAWSMDPYHGEAVRRSKEVAALYADQKIRTVVWVGIGGSSLGPRVIRDVFEGPETVEFIVLDTIDPSMLQMTMDIVDWKHTLLIVASKSGDTLEPMSVFFLCYERMQEARKEKAPEFTIALTDPHKGALRSFALQHGIRMLPLPPDVGGRYSIFTPIGTLPLALLGGDVDAFIRGAKEMDLRCQSTNLEGNPAAELAATQFLLDTKRGCNVRVVMPYMHRLESFGRWNQQLIAESLGKTELSNPIPLAAIGTQDQHSLLQQWMAGPRKQWHIFIRDREKPELKIPKSVESSFSSIAGKRFGELQDACYEGTSSALTKAKRPHVTITLDRLDEENLGSLFFLFLVEVVLLGKLYRIDPYGQPAVETGKEITRQLLELP